MLADLDHRFGNRDGLLGQSRAQPTREDNDLHAVPRNGMRSSASRRSPAENSSICRRVTAPTSSPSRDARYQSAVHATASSKESNGRQPRSVRARVASSVRSDASCGWSPASRRQPGRPSQRAVNACTSSETERKLSASGPKFRAAGTRTASVAIACASIR